MGKAFKPPRKGPLTLPSPPSDGGEGINVERGVLTRAAATLATIGWGRGQGEGAFKDSGTGDAPYQIQMSWFFVAH
jgi:hypothetical protein